MSCFTLRLSCAIAVYVCCMFNSKRKHDKIRHHNKDFFWHDFLRPEIISCVRHKSHPHPRSSEVQIPPLHLMQTISRRPTRWSIRSFLRRHISSYVNDALYNYKLACTSPTTPTTVVIHRDCTYPNLTVSHRIKPRMPTMCGSIVWQFKCGLCVWADLLDDLISGNLNVEHLYLCMPMTSCVICVLLLASLRPYLLFNYIHWMTGVRYDTKNALPLSPIVSPVFCVPVFESE